MSMTSQILNHSGGFSIISDHRSCLVILIYQFSIEWNNYRVQIISLSCIDPHSLLLIASYKSLFVRGSMFCPRFSLYKEDRIWVGTRGERLAISEVMPYSLKYSWIFIVFVVINCVNKVKHWRNCRYLQWQSVFLVLLPIQARQFWAYSKSPWSL